MPRAGVHPPLTPLQKGLDETQMILSSQVLQKENGIQEFRGKKKFMGRRRRKGRITPRIQDIRVFYRSTPTKPQLERHKSFCPHLDPRSDRLCKSLVQANQRIKRCSLIKETLLGQASQSFCQPRIDRMKQSLIDIVTYGEYPPLATSL